MDKQLINSLLYTIKCSTIYTLRKKYKTVTGDLSNSTNMYTSGTNMYYLGVSKVHRCTVTVTSLYLFSESVKVHFSICSDYNRSKVQFQQLLRFSSLFLQMGPGDAITGMKFNQFNTNQLFVSSIWGATTLRDFTGSVVQVFAKTDSWE